VEAEVEAAAIGGIANGGVSEMSKKRQEFVAGPPGRVDTKTKESALSEGSCELLEQLAGALAED
jgi:hypothetical protein